MADEQKGGDRKDLFPDFVALKQKNKQTLYFGL
jgi:hypothetical protein